VNRYIQVFEGTEFVVLTHLPQLKKPDQVISGGYV